MFLLSLDLSTVGSGWSTFNQNGELVEYGVIKPSDKLHNFEKIKYIVNELKPRMKDAEHLVIEDIFLSTFAGFTHNVTGFAILAKLSGAVVNKWLAHHSELPTLYKATEARRLVGIKGTCQKAEVQLWVIKNVLMSYSTPINCDINDFDSLIDAESAQLLHKEISRETFKKHMNHISKMIEEETKLDENMADSILLGKAWFNDARSKNVKENN